MLLRHSLKLEAEADDIEQAVGRALAQGARTGDLSGDNPLTTEQMGEAVRRQLSRMRPPDPGDGGSRGR